MQYEKVLAQLKPLKPLKGIDGIKALVLKHLPEDFLKHLLHIYNIYMKDGKFSKIWKRPLLILIPKGEVDLCNPSFRPICLLNKFG